jgi:hypothetical protein
VRRPGPTQKPRLYPSRPRPSAERTAGRFPRIFLSQNSLRSVSPPRSRFKRTHRGPPPARASCLVSRISCLVSRRRGAEWPGPPRSPGPTRNDPAQARNEQPATLDGSFSPGTVCEAPVRRGAGSNEPTALARNENEPTALGGRRSSRAFLPGPVPPPGPGARRTRTQRGQRSSRFRAARRQNETNPKSCFVHIPDTTRSASDLLEFVAVAAEGRSRACGFVHRPRTNPGAKRTQSPPAPSGCDPQF